MSNINFSDIDATFPVAGQDNPSKGFRDNWGYIKAALTTAKSEISRLETSAVLKTNIVNLNPVNNDLDGSTINNGTYNEFYGIHHAATAASIDVAVTANLANGSIHTITLVNDVDVNFSGWPITGSYAKVRVHLTTASATPIAITDFTSIAATVKIATEFPSPILVNTNKHLVIEAWSYDGGDTIFVQYIGEF
jgi:hypothetical protein